MRQTNPTAHSQKEKIEYWFETLAFTNEEGNPHLLIYLKGNDMSAFHPNARVNELLKQAAAKDR